MKKALTTQRKRVRWIRAMMVERPSSFAVICETATWCDPVYLGIQIDVMDVLEVQHVN